MPELSIEERVAAGAAWLDKHRPGWADAINLDQLDLADCTVCVLGQVYGDFWNAPLSDGLPGEWTRRATEMGFADDHGRYTELNEAWAALIDERRADDA